MANIQLTNNASEIDSTLSCGYVRLSQSFVGPTGGAGFTIRNGINTTGIYLTTNCFDFYSNTLNFNKANADLNINLYNGTNLNINSSTSNFKLATNGTLYIGASANSCKGLQISNTNPVIILRDCDNSLNQSQAFKFMDSGYVDIFYICQQANTCTSFYSCTDLNFVRQACNRLNLNAYGVGINGAVATSTYAFIVTGCSQFLNGFDVPSTACCIEVNTCVKFNSGFSFLDCNFSKYVQTGFTGCLVTTGYLTNCLSKYVQTGGTGFLASTGYVNNCLSKYVQTGGTGFLASTGYVNSCLNNYVQTSNTGNLVTTGSLNSCLTTFYAQNVNTGSFVTTGCLSNCLNSYVQTGNYLNIRPSTTGIHQISGSGMNINLSNDLCLNTKRVCFTGCSFYATGATSAFGSLIIWSGVVNQNASSPNISTLNNFFRANCHTFLCGRMYAQCGIYSTVNCSDVNYSNTYCFNSGAYQGSANFNDVVGWIDIVVGGQNYRVPYFN